MSKFTMPVGENPDGTLSRLGMELMQSYAVSWVGGKRDLDMERRYPELTEAFYDVRMDPKNAWEHARVKPKLVLPIEGV